MTLCFVFMKFFWFKCLIACDNHHIPKFLMLNVELIFAQKYFLGKRDAITDIYLHILSIITFAD